MKNGTVISAKTFVYPDGETKEPVRLIWLDGKWYRLDHVKSQPSVPEEYIGQTRSGG